MIKAYIGIDPGFSNIGVALRLLESPVLEGTFIPINIPVVIKRGFENKQAKNNWKLKSIFHKTTNLLSDMLKKHNLLASEVLCGIEGYFYRPTKPGQAKSHNNAAYDTVAAVAVIKAVMFGLGIEYVELLSTQMRRIITWKAYDFPDNQLDKDKVEVVVKEVMGADVIDSILNDYAKSHHEHIVDAIAFSFVVEHKQAYQKYMKIPLKKRKQMAGVK